MKTSQKIKSLRDGLAQFFCQPTHIKFTDAYGQVYVGISSSISERAPDPNDRKKPLLPITISFKELMRVEVVNELGTEHFIPAIGEKPRHYEFEFDVVNVQTEPKNSDGKNARVHAWVTANRKEHLVFSTRAQDFDRFNREILGTELENKT